MTQQQQQKATTWINLNTIITSLCTAVLIWVGAGTYKMYNALLLQPNIDAVQTSAIIILTNEAKELRTDVKINGNRITKLEAMLPETNQFKIKR